MTTDNVTGTSGQTYAFDNAWFQARERLAALEAVYDPGTTRCLAGLNVKQGSTCLEVGGGGSIARWLCRHVGPVEHVVATDIDTRFLHALDEPNLEVRTHNIVSDPLPEGKFDLVHTRFVLMHLPERQEILDRLTKALRPGGWLLVEEADLVSWVPDPSVDASAASLFMKCWSAAFALWAASGTDLTYGRRPYGAVGASDLEHVEAKGRVLMARGGSPLAHVWKLSLAQLRHRLLDGGQLAAEEPRCVFGFARCCGVRLDGIDEYGRLGSEADVNIRLLRLCDPVP